MPDEEPVVVIAANYCIDYMDEYQVTMTSLGPNPNRVRQYLRKRFVFTLAEVLKVQIPITLLSTSYPEEAERVKSELVCLGAEVWVKWKPGGPNNDTYPEVRTPLLYQVT